MIMPVGVMLRGFSDVLRCLLSPIHYLPLCKKKLIHSVLVAIPSANCQTPNTYSKPFSVPCFFDPKAEHPFILVTEAYLMEVKYNVVCFC